MTYDEYDRTPWLQEIRTVPWALQRALDLRGREARCNILDALGDQLGLRMENAREATYRALETLVDPLAVALDEGAQFLDLRHIEMAKQVAWSLDLKDAQAAMIQLGWGRDRIDSCEVTALEDEVRDKLKQRLLPTIQRMMLRWGRRGLFDLAS